EPSARYGSLVEARPRRGTRRRGGVGHGSRERAATIARVTAESPSETAPENSAPEKGKRSPFAVLADAGAAGQAVVPGVYAWAVTVIPAAWSRSTGANIGVKVAAVLALAALLQTLFGSSG